MPIGPTLQEGRVFTFRTAKYGQDELVVGKFQFAEAISRPFELTFELLSQQEVDSSVLLSTPCRFRIKFPRPGAGSSTGGKSLPPVLTSEIFGVVSAFARGQRAGDWTVYSATMVPRLWLLSLTVRSRVFQNLTVPEIVTSILQEYQLQQGTDFVFALGARRTYRKREYVVQYQESDLNFISRLLEDDGIFYLFDHAGRGGTGETVVFGDSASAYLEGKPPITLDYRSVELSDSAVWQAPELIDRFAFEHRLVATGVVLGDYNYRTPQVSLLSSPQTPPPPIGPGIHYEYGNHYKTPAEGKELAQIRLEELQCQERRFRGSGNCKTLRAGTLFTLQNHDRFDGKFVAVEVHAAGDQEFSLGAATNIRARYSNSFTCLPSTQAFRPERLTPRPRIVGAVNALVDGTGNGQYAELDAQGRYKVVLPFDAAGRSGGNASRAIRMAQPYAGPGYGLHFPVHKGTEVLLTHVNGDPDRPVIAHAIHDAASPDVVTASNQTQGVLRSAGGNEISFDDTQGAERLFLQAQKNLDVRVKGSERRLLGRDCHRVVTNDDHLHVKNDRHVTVDQDVFEKIGADHHLTIKGQQAVDIGGRLSIVAGGDVSAIFNASHFETVSGTLYFQAGDVVIDATTQLTLSCGGNSIVVDANGITLTGALVTIDGKQTMINSGAGSPAATAVQNAPVNPALPAPALTPGQSKAGTKTVRSAGQQQTVAAKQGKATWVAIDLVDDQGTPVANEPYELQLPDGTIVAGRLDQNGYARVDGVTAGQCQVRFPRLDGAAWRPA